MNDPVPDDFMNHLTFTDEAVPDDEIPPPLRPGEDVMVPRSVRWPLDLDQRLKAAAQARGLPMSQLMRQFAEAGLAAMADDQPISRAEVMRIIAGMRPLGRSA
jgi:predicted DNA-binding protein